MERRGNPPFLLLANQCLRGLQVLYIVLLGEKPPLYFRIKKEDDGRI